jgi:PTS system cellobiose-specific IIB component
MKNILLVCSTGMSTAMMVQKMQKAAEKLEEEVKVWAIPENELSKNISQADVILLGPQIRFMLEKFKADAGTKPVGVIDMRDYGVMNGEKVLKAALDLMVGTK